VSPGSARPTTGASDTVAILCPGTLAEPSPEALVDLVLIGCGEATAKLLSLHLEASLVQFQRDTEPFCGKRTLLVGVVHARIVPPA
jgi:hypothetical protein